VATVMSNAGLDAVIQAAGGRVVRTPVGDKNVIDEMLRGGYSFGGEQSGHMIFRDHSTTGDGLVCALQILRIMKSSNRPLSELARCWKRFPQLQENLRVREKRPLEELTDVNVEVQAAQAELQPAGGRVLLRYSGTEPKVRLLLEGPDPAVLERWKERILTPLRRQVGA
jgi:phosphoglucosamine mutase